MTGENWQERYNAGLIITLRVRIPDEPGAAARLLKAIGDAGASIGNIMIVGAESRYIIRDVQVFLLDESRLDATIDAVRALDGFELLLITDDVLEIHRHGAIETRSRVPLDTTMHLRMVYTPGVASVCELIAEKPEQAWKYTARGHRIAIVTNGTAVLGLGDIGPLAGLPVMEGKAAILAHFVQVSADPMLVDSRDPGEIVDTVARLALGYGAIQLEDIGAPACFEIERDLQARLDIPVFHDDQHGTATVVVAGLLNALKMVRRQIEDTRAVILGAGAAGTAIAGFLADLGVPDLVVCDSVGALYAGRPERMNPWKEALAQRTNAGGVRGRLADVMRGRNLFIGVARPNIVSPDMIKSMDRDAIVFALANPVSEIPVEDALAAGAAIAVDGRSMNNALAYPGIFRGALDARAKRIDHGMKLAAARALADAAAGTLLPEMLDHTVHRRVAAAVAHAARGG